MSFTCRSSWKTVSCAGLLLFALSVCGTKPARAQSQGTEKPEVEQLKDELQKLEQMMNDVKQRISALEAAPRAPGTTPSTTPSTLSTPPPSPTAPLAAEQKKAPPQGGSVELYGFAMLDSGYDFKTNNPDWFDVVRPTQLPAFAGEYAPDGKTYWGVRQSRLGVKTSTPTQFGDLNTIFEFELFGTGVDAGQTTFRLRQAYGELGHFGAGQTWSPFMDIDVFPNSIEYWGPNGMAFFRNVQFRWMPIKGKSRVTIAVERPGASADGGVYADRIELQNVKPKFDVPDFSWEARLGRKWGYVELAGIFRKISWVDTAKTATQNLSGDAFGWGLNLSSNLYFTKKDTGRFQVLYGPGVENYMNDAPIDIGVKNNPSNPVTPIQGVPLPLLGVVAFLDHNWSDRFSSSIGYSMENIWNSDAQLPSDFHQGHYALTNLLFTPVKNVMVGGEFQFGRRVNFSDGFNVNDYRLQFSFRYNFSKLFEY